MYFNQEPFEIRCEWGLEGISQLAPTSDAIIIIDIFSFTTSVDIALSRDAQVYPFSSREISASTFAQSIGALLADRNRSDPQSFSLSPTSLLRLPRGSKLVLPSPNGSTLSLATGSTPTFAACLRNAKAVAQSAQVLGKRVSLIPAGERWLDNSLRPALEDWIGAGAVIQHLQGTCSPDAQAARAVFQHFSTNLLETLSICGSGKEIADRGTPRDIDLASELYVSRLVPRLVDGAYRAI